MYTCPAKVYYVRYYPPIYASVSQVDIWLFLLILMCKKKLKRLNNNDNLYWSLTLMEEQRLKMVKNKCKGK
jgi:hypothetical protein